MTSIELKTENFERVTSRKGIVLVQARPKWRPPCTGSPPASERHTDHVFAKLDTQAEKELRLQLGIEHIPSLLVFRDGVLVYNSPGSPPSEALDEIVAQAEALDMDAVREQEASRASSSD